MSRAHPSAAAENQSRDHEKIDRALMRHVQRDMFGASAHHGLDPAEICMRLDEWEAAEHALRDRASLRNEIFSGFAEYLFADGPAPDAVRSRIEGLFQSFLPDSIAQIKGPLLWVDPETVAAVLGKKHYRAKLLAAQDAARSRGSLYSWSRELDAEQDLECVRQTIAGLIAYLVSDGITWRNAVAVAYGIAKSLRPQLIADMSLHDIAILSGDGKKTGKSARATAGERIQRIYNRRVAASGAKATSVHFQKAAGTVAKYAEAQQGNHNRVMKRKPSKKPKH